MSKGAGDRVQKHLPVMRAMTRRSKRRGLLNDDATVASAAISIDGGGRLVRRLGLGAGGEEGEEIHRCVKM